MITWYLRTTEKNAEVDKTVSLGYGINADLDKDGKVIGVEVIT